MAKTIVHTMTWQSTPSSAVIGVRCLSTCLAAWSHRHLFTEQLICKIEPPYVSAHAIASRYAGKKLVRLGEKLPRKTDSRLTVCVMAPDNLWQRSHAVEAKRDSPRPEGYFFLERIKSAVQSSWWKTTGGSQTQSTGGSDWFLFTLLYLPKLQKNKHCPAPQLVQTLAGKSLCHQRGTLVHNSS